MSEKMRTDIGRANAERITLRGHDLVRELIGRVSFTEAALLAITGELPNPGAVRVADAVLVTFIDHGLQPSALVSRLTYGAAPDAIQGAIAAGLLGVGSQILGTMEQTARLLTQIAEETSSGTSESEAVARAIGAELDAGHLIPGFGHSLHRAGDPRAKALLEIAADQGIARDEVRLLHAIAGETGRRTGHALPLNAAGASAALLLGIGIPWWLQRGLSMISRSAGLVAHIREESERPIAPAIRESLRVASWLE